jgi:hypothetical protein
MQNNIVRYLISFVAIIMLQVLVLTKFAPGWSTHAMVYPMLIISLPFNMKPIWLMFIGLCLGLCVDAFTNTFGLHASAAVFLAYARPELMKLISPKDGYDYLLKPTIKDMGFKWYGLITLVLLAIHHLWFFIFESLNLYDFGFILLKTLLSVIVSWILIIAIQYIFYKATKELK